MKATDCRDLIVVRSNWASRLLQVSADFRANTSGSVIKRQRHERRCECLNLCSFTRRPATFFDTQIELVNYDRTKRHFRAPESLEPRSGLGQTTSEQSNADVRIEQMGHSKLGGGSGVPCGCLSNFSSVMDPQTRSKNPV